MSPLFLAEGAADKIAVGREPVGEPELLQRATLSGFKAGRTSTRNFGIERVFEFSVLEFASSAERKMWTYATRCMSVESDQERIELHLFSPQRDESLVELLTFVAHYHRTGSRLNLWHTVNFGRHWLPGSRCDFGLVSLPYLDGPTLQELRRFDGSVVNFYWLIPITKAERDHKRDHGVGSLEQVFEEKRFNYLDVKRDSVI